jgi:cellobiose phosphorylase
MSYGHFDNERQEYVITDFRTPVRWINYLGTLDLGGYVDQTGGVLLCKGDPAFNRITRYMPGLPNSTMNGTAFYLRISEKNGRRRVVSPFFVPCASEVEDYECRVGLFYTDISGTVDGIRLKVRFFVPEKSNALIMDCEIANTGNAPRQVDFIPAVEYSHFDALKQYTNADWVPQTMQSRGFSSPEGHTTLVQYAFMNRDTRWNFFTSNVPTDSFETDRDRFLGANGYGSWAEPQALLSDRLSSYEALRGDNIAALLHRLGELGAGEHRRIILQLGQSGAIGDPARLGAKYRDPAACDRAFRRGREFWSEYLSALTVQTPSQAMNDMLNVHHPKQCYITKNWSRYLSSYQLGLGSRGLGMRDSSQDLLGVMGHMSGEASALMRRLLGLHRPDGSAMHQFYPSTGEANQGDSREMEDRPDYYGDDHLWVLLALGAYIRETGDLSILQEEIPYYALPGEKPEAGSVGDHINRALCFTREHTGKHGLPLLGFADWNDTVNLPTGAESLFNASLYGVALNEMIELMDYAGDHGRADEYRGFWREMRDTVNREGWDGEWYLRYFTADGRPIGSATNDKGKIYVNGQSWPVMAGYAGEDRARTSLDAVHRHLNTPNGIKVSWPGYDGYDPEIGGISTYPPGAKENGGIFLHTNPWVIIARTMLGDGNLAWEYYRQINPAEKDSDVYQVEPYCYAQNILSDEHPQEGLGRNSWLSGTAAWTYRAATWHILGIRPGYRGLQVDPCIPSEWTGYSAVRRYRGGEYRIRVENPDGVQHGVASCTVDGVAADPSALPVLPAGSAAEVVVVLG